MNNYSALRIDDIGASSKQFQVYGNTWIPLGKFGLPFPLANFLFFKYIKPFKRGGPYRELSARQWLEMLGLLRNRNLRMTVAVTASWVQDKDTSIPFPKKFPLQAGILREAAQEGLVEIANHGLTHCVTEDNAFKPKLFAENRKYHREFWDWVPLATQEEHIKLSQGILQDFFQTEVVTFVPPGNVFQDDTLRLAQKYGIRYVSCNTESRVFNGITVIGNEKIIAFHDKDIVYRGMRWFENIIAGNSEKKFVFVRDIADEFKKQ